MISCISPEVFPKIIVFNLGLNNILPLKRLPMFEFDMYLNRSGNAIRRIRLFEIHFAMPVRHYIAPFRAPEPVSHHQEPTDLAHAGRGPQPRYPIETLSCFVKVPGPF